MRFLETPVFTAEVLRLLDDEQYRALQLALLLRPEQGALIKGSGGLRKVRWSLAGRGKRGGTGQDDLTPAQLKVLKQLVREEFN